MPTEVETGEKPEIARDFVSDEDTREFIKRVVKDHPEQSVYILPREGADEILTEKRMELIKTLREDDPESVRGLARKLDRDVKSVSRDLDVLWKNDIVEYREEENRKIPELTTEKIIVQPL